MDDITLEFIEKRETYEQLEKIAFDHITNIIKQQNFFVMEVTHRTKTPESLDEKIKRKAGKYTCLDDITDLVGIRVICYFSDTIDAMAKALRKICTVDEKNSIDKRASIEATQFGYISLHYICTFRKDSGVPDFYTNIPFEVQIRTVLQHAWAQIEHDLGYKSTFGVPRPIRREFSRVAGLLELADKEFIEIRDASIAYDANIKERIVADEADNILLDRLSLKEYMRHSTLICNFMERVDRELGISIEIIDPDDYVKQLEWLGFDTLGDVSAAFKENEETVFKRLKHMSDVLQIDIITSSAILKMICEAMLLKGDFSRAQLRKFFSLSVKDSSKIDSAIEKLKKKKL